MVKPRIRNYNYDPNHQHKPIKTIRDFKKYEMFVVKQGTKKPLPLVFGDVSWTDNRESLGMSLLTNLPRNIDDRFLRNYDVVKTGDTIIFKNKEDVIFSGLVEEVNLGRHSKDIVCYDPAFLLNKNSIIKQFSKISGSSAIEQLCRENGIPVGKIVGMKSIITEIYKNQSISDIIRDIVQREEKITGSPMVIEVRDNKLYVDFVANLRIEMEYKPASNVSLFDPRETIGDINRSDSIVDTKNEVVVVYEKDKKIRTVATARDSSSIDKYGKRSHVESISKDELNQASSIANNKLRELNKIKTNITVELLGDDKVRAGRLVNINNKTFGLQGDYIIENCEHTYSNNNRKMRLELRGV